MGEIEWDAVEKYRKLEKKAIAEMEEVMEQNIHGENFGKLAIPSELYEWHAYGKGFYAMLIDPSDYHACELDFRKAQIPFCSVSQKLTGGAIEMMFICRDADVPKAKKIQKARWNEWFRKCDEYCGLVPRPKLTEGKNR